MKGQGVESGGLKDSELNKDIPRLSGAEFEQLSRLVYQQCGIKLPPVKKVLLESRLHKRLRALSHDTFKEYVQYVTSKEGLAHKLMHMIDVVSTNKTDFFREAHHFELLKSTLLPRVESVGRSFKVWSAACSSGEEVYTLAMVLQEYALIHKAFDFEIFGSDISTQVLEKATKAVYSLAQAEDIPNEFKRKYLLRSKDRMNPTVRIVPELRRKATFARINLMDTDLPVNEIYDAIFCRNVLIYFDRITQAQVLAKLLSKLRSGGYLFIGHSESLFQMDLPIKQVVPTVYVKN